MKVKYFFALVVAFVGIVFILQTLVLILVYGKAIYAEPSQPILLSELFFVFLGCKWFLDFIKGDKEDENEDKS